MEHQQLGSPFPVASLIPMKRKAGGDAGVSFKLRRLNKIAHDDTEASFESGYHILSSATLYQQHSETLHQQLEKEREDYRVQQQHLATIHEQLRREKEERRAEQQHLFALHEQLKREREERWAEQQHIFALNEQLKREIEERWVAQQHLATLNQQLENEREDRRAEKHHLANLFQDACCYKASVTFSQHHLRLASNANHLLLIEGGRIIDDLRSQLSNAQAQIVQQDQEYPPVELDHEMGGEMQDAPATQDHAPVELDDEMSGETQDTPATQDYIPPLDEEMGEDVQDTSPIIQGRIPVLDKEVGEGTQDAPVATKDRVLGQRVGEASSASANVQGKRRQVDTPVIPGLGNYKPTTPPSAPAATTALLTATRPAPEQRAAHICYQYLVNPGVPLSVSQLLCADSRGMVNPLGSNTPSASGTPSANPDPGEGPSNRKILNASSTPSANLGPGEGPSNRKILTARGHDVRRSGLAGLSILNYRRELQGLAPYGVPYNHDQGPESEEE